MPNIPTAQHLSTSSFIYPSIISRLSLLGSFQTFSTMQFSTSALLALFAAAGALALPEFQLASRCAASQAICAGNSYVGDDSCRCDDQIPPCGNWKCGWDGAHSIVRISYLQPRLLNLPAGLPTFTAGRYLILDSAILTMLLSFCYR